MAKLTLDQLEFIKQMEKVSIILADWIEERFKLEWSIEDVKIAIRGAMEVCERN